MILLLQELGSVDRVAATQNNYDDDHIHGQCNGLTGGRFLGTTKYIFPGVLRADQPVCGKLVRGEAYSEVVCLRQQTVRTEAATSTTGVGCDVV
jgi:hypothetical protein